MHIGSRIEKLRLEKGITRRQLSEILSLKYHIIRNLEYGAKVKNYEIIISDIANYFQINIDDLFEARGRSPPVGDDLKATAKEIKRLAEKIINNL
ncbi:MAG: hypothetical protein HQK49_19645 [Oligoflexia bacterium]|nr:hypothetical protein [Oligoflexia bacterium]